MPTKNQSPDALATMLQQTQDDGPAAPHRHGLWRPGILLMRQLRFISKAVVICTAFLIPLGWIGYAYYANMAAQLDFSRQEQVGVEYNRAATALLLALQRQSLGQAGPGPAPDSAPRSLMAQLREREQTQGAALHTGQAFATVNRTWEAWERQPDAAALTALRDALAGLIRQATDGSNLTLDPDIDSYYLMDASYFQWPAWSEGLTDIHRALADFGPSAQATPALLSTVAQKTGTVVGALQTIEAGLSKVRAQNPEAANALQGLEVIKAAQKLADSQLQALLAGQAPSALATQMASQAQTVWPQVEALHRQLQQQLDRAIGLRVAAMEHARNVATTVLVSSLLLAGYLFYAFYLVTLGGLRLVSRHLSEVSEGNFLNRPRAPWGSDEPAEVIHAVRRAYDALRVLIRRVRHSARSIQLAADEIAKGTTDLGQRTENSAVTLEQQSQALTEIQNHAAEAARHASEASSFASDNAQAAAQAGSVFSRVVDTMNDIHDSSGRINDIIAVIDGIAFQTNILALNAAVEAARAGESGRGFSVVAAEVRVLAQRSSAAATEIKQLVGSNMEKASQGAHAVQEAGTGMQAVVHNARQINTYLNDIASAAQTQATAVTTAVAAITTLDGDLQQNAALVEETNSATLALAGQAQGLIQEISNFQVAKA